MKLLEGNYDCYLQSQRPIRYLTPFPGETSNTTMCVLISKNYPPRGKKKKPLSWAVRGKMASTAYPVTWLTLSSTPRVLAFSQSQLSVGEYFPHDYKSINKPQQTTPPACIWSHQIQKCGQKKKSQGGSRTTVLSLKWIASGFSWAGHKAGWRCNTHVTDTGRWADICCTGSSESAFCLRHGISLTLSWTGCRCGNPHTSSSGLSLAVRVSVTLRLLKGLTFTDSRRGVGGFPSAPCLTDPEQE